MPHHVRKPYWTYGGEENERTSLFLSCSQVAVPVPKPAENPQGEAFYDKAERERQEDPRSQETGDAD